MKKIGRWIAFTVGTLKDNTYKIKIIDKITGKGETATHVTHNGNNMFFANYKGYLDDLKSCNIKHWHNQYRIHKIKRKILARITSLIK